MKLSMTMTADGLVRALRWEGLKLPDAMKEQRRKSRGTLRVIDPELRKRARARRKAFKDGLPT